MQLSFSYQKKKVIQALRYHFLSRPEVRIMLVLVNVFAVIAAILSYTKSISPQSFLLGSFTWLLMMLGVWYIMPNTVYKKTSVFKEKFIIVFHEDFIHLENEKAYVDWDWKSLIKYFESPHFFHIYFNQKTFFLIPKDDMSEEFKHELRGLLRKKIK